MTDNPQSVVDSGAFTVRRTISIAASVDSVWAAVTQPNLISKWFGDSAELPEFAVGADGVFGWNDYGDFPIRIEEIDPPSVVAYRWANSARPNADAPLDFSRSTVFRFTLEPIATGTQLTVVETGFDALEDPTASMESNRGGWNSELDELVAYLEGGA